jgi:GNAT superfamily N-acetyltransferase
MSEPIFQQSPDRPLPSARGDDIEYRATKDLPRDGVLVLYGACRWTCAEAPDQLMAALAGSHTVISAWDRSRLVGVGTAITDGSLVVYYPHLLVHPDYQRRGIGRGIVKRLTTPYQHCQQHVLLSDGETLAFYRECGFGEPQGVRPMWIYSGQHVHAGDKSRWTDRLAGMVDQMRSGGRRWREVFGRLVEWRERPARQTWSLACVLIQLLSALLMVVCFFVEFESILFTPFLLAASGYALAMFTWVLRSRRVLTFALSGPIVMIVGSLIAILMQNSAGVIVIIMLLLAYPIAAAWESRKVIELIQGSSFERRPMVSDPWRQYSLKTMLIFMTAIAFIVMLGMGLAELASHDDVYVGMAVFAVVNIVFSGLIVWRFIAEQRTFAATSVENVA